MAKLSDTYTQVNNRIVRNSDGMVALQHYNSNGAVARIDGTDIYYNWMPKHNVSLAWVAPEHVERLLLVQTRICCGKHSNKFIPASAINVNLWHTGNREGEYSG